MSKCERHDLYKKPLMIKQSHLAANCVENHYLHIMWVEEGGQYNTVKDVSPPELQSDTGGGENGRVDLVW